MEGPGACNGHFYKLGENAPRGAEEEIINTTPGSLYSTAVLFPQKKRAETINQQVEEPVIQVQDSELISDSNYQELQDDNSSEELDERVNRLGADEEDLYSLSQRFPTTIGISCCLDKKGEPLDASDLNITVSGRYYTKVPKKECNSIIIRVDDNDGFGDFFSKYSQQLSPYFTRVDDGIHLTSDISNVIGSVKDLILSINKELCKGDATNMDGSIDEEYVQIGDNYRYLKSYKERLWRRIRYFKDSYISTEERAAIESRIKKLSVMKRICLTLKTR